MAKGAQNVNSGRTLDRVGLDAKRLDFVPELSAHYAQSRYPEEIETLGKAVTREKAESILRDTEEIAEWPFSMLQ